MIRYKLVKNRAPISKKVKDSIRIIAIGIFAALLFSLLDGDTERPIRILGAVIMGSLGSGFIVLNEIWFPRPILRELKFSGLVIYKSIIYSIFFVVIIVLVASIVRSIEEETTLLGYWASEAFYSTMKVELPLMVVYSLAATVLFIFVYQISRKMGQGVLWSFISGKYHHAKEEERIFMFMDINESTALAENLGDIEYNNLLNDFFFDITDSILAHYGVIYRYVGDEVVVSWKLKKGLEEANFIRTFFDAKRAIYMNREKYLQQYGIVPGFTAGFNSGKVMVGEIGEVKSQISFFGNVMYETTEIEKSCKKYNAEVLVSESLLCLVDIPQIFMSKEEGVVEVPSLESLRVFSIAEKI